MCGEDQSNRRAARPVGISPGDAAERLVERFRRDPTMSGVVAPPAKPVELLSEVRKLEPHSERPQDERLLARRKRRVDVCDGAVAPGLPGGATDALDELEQPRAFLLDE